VVVDPPFELLFRRMWIPLAFRRFLHRLSPPLAIGNCTKKLMKKLAVTRLIFSTKTSGKTCGKAPDSRRNHVFLTCAKPCGIPVGNERKDSGSMAEKTLPD